MGAVVLKCKDKLGVLVLNAARREGRKETHIRQGATEKPEAIIDCNTSKSFIDVSGRIKSNSWFTKTPNVMVPPNCQ
jgi:hypothetical protein